MGAAVAATAVALAWLFAAMARNLEREGASASAATLAAIVAAGVGSIHFLVRPHLFTLAFVAWALAACRAFHLRGGRSIWAVPIVMIAWANLHGGFLAGPLIVATAAVGHAVSGSWDAERRRRVGTFAAVAALSALTPLVNPYGFGLYRHVWNLLVSSGVTPLILEYQPVAFGEAGSRLLEGLVLALIALPAFSKLRPSRYDLAHVVIWLHLALTSIRHAPLFGLAAAPTIARIIDGLLSDPAGEVERPSRRWQAWPALASLVILATAALGVDYGGHDPKTWPLAALPALDREPVDARLFHEQDWGGLIEDRCRPARKAFLDDRFEIWGKGPILEYVAAMDGGPAWEGLRDRSAITRVWLRPDRKLARLLLADPDWEVVHRDGVSILLRRKHDGSSTPKGAVALTTP